MEGVEVTCKIIFRRNGGEVEAREFDDYEKMMEFWKLPEIDPKWTTPMPEKAKRRRKK